MEQKTQGAFYSLLAALAAAAALAWAGSQNGATAFGLPLFALCVFLSVLIQWFAFIPAYRLQTERFYDLTGSFTFLLLLATIWLLGPLPDGRTMLLSLLIAIWAIRLGSFLFRRIRRSGKDGRFDEFKPSLIRFLLVWTMQGLWVSFSLAAALAAMTTTLRKDLDVFAWIGALIWLLGFGIEVIADHQKHQFRKRPENKDRFITTGLWAWSRHPNYFGEIVLWIGIAIIAVPVLRGWQWITLISPFFVIFLLTKVSGIPMLEERADEKWGGQADYEAYKKRTPVLVPKWPD
jgi:steroid 5-alpha reductase family enzyme